MTDNISKQDDSRNSEQIGKPHEAGSDDPHSTPTSRPKAQAARFVVDDKPWCVWDWNLGQLNGDFLNGFDPTYFDYLAEIHGRALADGTMDQHAAVALRTTYAHAMETLFALIGASIQAPECVVGWLHKYSNSQLDAFVRKIHHRQRVHSKLRLDEYSWQGYANVAFTYLSLKDKTKEERIKKEFTALWTRLAEDFLSDQNSSEYNAFKHGMRLRSGGFHLAAGQEESPGTPCPPEQMKPLGGSRFGSSFYVPKAFEGVDARNLHMVHHSLNWIPSQFICRIQLISMSLRNLLSFLRILLGADAAQQQFVWPANFDMFSDCWRGGVGVTEASFNLVITKDDITPQNKDQIMDGYGPTKGPTS